MTNYKNPLDKRPTTLPVSTFSIREVTVDIQADDLRVAGEGYDVLILRVAGMTSHNGRPVTRSLRIPTDMLRVVETDWAN